MRTLNQQSSQYGMAMNGVTRLTEAGQEKHEGRVTEAAGSGRHSRA